jgi:hypothetical protein
MIGGGTSGFALYYSFATLGGSFPIIGAQSPTGLISALTTFFNPNDLKRYSLGTKNKDLKYNSDGSLTIYVQTHPPTEAQRNNWLPAPKGDFSLFVRTYWPKTAVLDGSWTPPAVNKTN